MSNIDGSDINVGSIDKDIEILRDITRLNFGYSNTMVITEAKHKEIKQATENVLDELKNLQDDLRIHEETSFDFQKENIELREEIKERHIKHIALAIENEDLEKELETYKKIAEKLAEELEKCSLDDKEGLLDWARKEVENEN